MNKLVACAATLAILAACGQEQSGVPEGGYDRGLAPEPDIGAMEDYLGAWDVTYPDGSTGVTTNNEDGSYDVVLDNGAAFTGLWSYGEDKSCWQAEETEEATCYVVSDSDENGTRTLTADDGSALIVSPASSEAE